MIVHWFAHSFNSSLPVLRGINHLHVMEALGDPRPIVIRNRYCVRYRYSEVSNTGIENSWYRQPLPEDSSFSRVKVPGGPNPPYGMSPGNSVWRIPATITASYDDETWQWIGEGANPTTSGCR